VSNVLNEQIKQQIIALGRLGWSLRRIQKSTGVRRETAATYLREAGVAVRPPGLWGRGSPVAEPLPATVTETGIQLPGAKPAIAVTTDFGAELAPSAGFCETHPNTDRAATAAPTASANGVGADPADAKTAIGVTPDLA
jgi:hypothetical protein